jgi:hypothetical protein
MELQALDPVLDVTDRHDLAVEEVALTRSPRDRQLSMARGGRDAAKRIGQLGKDRLPSCESVSACLHDPMRAVYFGAVGAPIAWCPGRRQDGLAAGEALYQLDERPRYV